MSSMDGSGETPCRPQSAGSKQIKCERLRDRSVPALIGKASGNKSAPTSRIYTKDYSKVSPEKGDSDQVGPFLGNPFKW